MARISRSGGFVAFLSPLGGARARGTMLTVGVLAALAGCSSHESRPLMTDAQLQEQTAVQGAQMAKAVTVVASTIVNREWKEVEAAKPGTEPTLNFLAISGGGDYGAFGAGFLVGWGQTADPAMRRPEFDVVTGVSTGALLAPFAYVGTDESCASVEAFYRNPRSDWVEDRGFLFFLPSNPSFMVIPKLAESLKEAIPTPMVEQMAAQFRQGKVLLISATDLDYGRQHVWNLGLEAEKAVQSGNSDRVRQIMLASAAIPVVFPPVEIDGSLYADGGVTANVFVRLDPNNPNGVIQTWNRLHPGIPLPKTRFWVIVNNSLAQPPKTVQAKWPEVLGPSLATSIRSATIAEIRWLAAQADYINATMHTDIEVRVVAIPDDWRPPVAGDFQKETMNSLADIGRKMGSDPSSWKLWASPKHAGFSSGN